MNPELDIIENHPLDALNTMALPARAEYFCRVNNCADIQQALAFARQRQLAISVLGAGSNIILAGNLSGLVIQVALVGISTEAKDKDTVLISAAAGEVWHDLVLNMVEQGYYGIENLSLIPGLVGAAPVQNIGAYGVELSDCFVSLEAISIATGEATHFSARDCQFAYRHSVFKTEHRDAYIITSVTLALHRQAKVNIRYPALRAALDDQLAITPQLISETVCRIRREKLPDPAIEPNVGSFFKNPVISQTQAKQLTEQYPDLVTYVQNDDRVKIPAAWLIDKAGWKGVHRDNCGVHPQHALVLTQFGNATGGEILALAKHISIDIKQCFGIDLEMEPRVLGG
jgi:UDP-N-acetylmuramate dehydrogenase